MKIRAVLPLGWQKRQMKQFLTLSIVPQDIPSWLISNFHGFISNTTNSILQTF
jgi:hypothetical protein